MITGSEAKAELAEGEHGWPINRPRPRTRWTFPLLNLTSIGSASSRATRRTRTAKRSNLNTVIGIHERCGFRASRIRVFIAVDPFSKGHLPGGRALAAATFGARARSQWASPAATAVVVQLNSSVRTVMRWRLPRFAKNLGPCPRRRPRGWGMGVIHFVERIGTTDRCRKCQRPFPEGEILPGSQDKPPLNRDKEMDFQLFTAQSPPPRMRGVPQTISWRRLQLGGALRDK